METRCCAGLGFGLVCFALVQGVKLDSIRSVKLNFFILLVGALLNRIFMIGR